MNKRKADGPAVDTLARDLWKAGIPWEIAREAAWILARDGHLTNTKEVERRHEDPRVQA